MKIPATIFMPITTPQQKIGQVRFFGGDFVTIKLVGDTFDASAKAAQEFTVSENRRYLINGREVTPEEFAHYRATGQLPGNAESDAQMQQHASGMKQDGCLLYTSYF